MKMVYLDNAATTQVSPEVLSAMLPAFSEHYGNPSSVHAVGRDAKGLVDKARAQVAVALGAQPSEIFFTAGGSEADNMALRGVAHASRKNHGRIITSQIEHHAILHTADALQKEGYDVVYLPVDGEGLVDPKALEAAMTDDTILVSIMLANNEIGTIEPIKTLATIAHAHGAYFHTDAVQAVGAVAIDVDELGVDLLSLSAHKIYGPKGVGALYVRKGTRFAPIITGGGQERGKRAGTENVPGIVGLGKAITLATDNLAENRTRLSELRDYLIAGLEARIADIRLNGHRVKRLPGNVNISIRYIEGESMLLMLDMKGICASSGSACTSGSLDPSHVLLAIGLPHEIAHGSLRLTLGVHTTRADIDYVLQELPPIVERLRAMSPLYQQEKGE
nr:cysteine desulfurase NifS [Maliibacterium massiliense]